MLISPLIGPIVAAGLALAVGDLYLGIKSLLNLIASVAAALLISAFLVWILPLHHVTTEILNRTQPNLLDLGVALLSGFAGSLLVFRRGGDGASALPGVAIAVALMPPLCTTGFGFGAGLNWTIISGAGLLFLTNLAAIVASAFLVFLCVRMGAAEVRSSIDRLMLERERAADDWLYRVIKRARLASPLGDVGKLHWRALMLVAILVALYVPLKKGLVQVRDEAVARAAVNEAVRKLATPKDIVGQQVSLGMSPQPVRVSLLITAPVSEASVRQAEMTIVRRTGRLAEVSVRQIADQAEIARLREGLETPAPPLPAQDLENLRRDVVARLDAALKEIWPPDLPLKGYELGFAPDAVVAHIQYESAEPLAAAAVAILTRSLESRLGLPSLRVSLDNLSPGLPKAQGQARRSRR
jgi:uncharacterized hydrophobic protein (TIGR00271 family)